MVKRVILAVLLMLGLVTGAKAAGAGEEPKNASLLTTVQAADLMSDLLTYIGGVAGRRIDAMRAYLGEIDKRDDYQIARPPAPKTEKMTFAEAFKGAIRFVEEGGARYADPALAKMSPQQLSAELEALQHYNLQQFLYLNTQRDEIARMRAYLESLGKFEDYLKWAAVHKPQTYSPLITPPTKDGEKPTAEAFTKWLEDQAASMKERAWKHAEATGMTRQQFDDLWKQKEQGLKNDIRQRIEAVKDLGAFYATRSDMPPTTGKEVDGVPATPGSGGVSIPPLPGVPQVTNVKPPPTGTPPVMQAPPMSPDDPRWQQYYYGPNNRFNGWNDNYADIYQPSGGGGVYRRYDTRVNDDSDIRVNGELDRRVNVSFDRRQNIQVDPRVNY